MNKLAAVIVLPIIITLSVLSCSEEEEVTFPIDRTPDVNITSPPDGSFYLFGDTVHFAGTATDEEDGVLPDSALVWYSDRDSLLGTGGEISRNDLSVNTHVIEFRGTDSSGKTGTDQVTITVDFYDFASVPGGTFDMGYENVAVPVHQVDVEPFMISELEVPYRLWEQIRIWSESIGYIYISEGRAGSADSPLVDEYHPVTEVSWTDCVVWCNALSEKKGLTPAYYYAGTSHIPANVCRLAPVTGDSCEVEPDAGGYRVPTEAEWEYAARYIDGSSFEPGNQHSGYSINSNISSCAWYEANSTERTHRGGMKTANNLGCYDMTGNVWEWCWDSYQQYPGGWIPAVHFGPAAGEARIIRGGSFNFSQIYCRTSFRGSSSPSNTNDNIGFRLCRNN